MTKFIVKSLNSESLQCEVEIGIEAVVEQKKERFARQSSAASKSRATIKTRATIDLFKEEIY